jgi:hypothetical protein
VRKYLRQRLRVIVEIIHPAHSGLFIHQYSGGIWNIYIGLTVVAPVKWSVPNVSSDMHRLLSLFPASDNGRRCGSSAS